MRYPKDIFLECPCLAASALKQDTLKSDVKIVVAKAVVCAVLNSSTCSATKDRTGLTYKFQN